MGGKKWEARRGRKTPWAEMAAGSKKNLKTRAGTQGDAQTESGGDYESITNSLQGTKKKGLTPSPITPTPPEGGGGVKTAPPNLSTRTTNINKPDSPKRTLSGNENQSPLYMFISKKHHQPSPPNEANTKETIARRGKCK